MYGSVLRAFPALDGREFPFQTGYFGKQAGNSRTVTADAIDSQQKVKSCIRLVIMFGGHGLFSQGLFHGASVCACLLLTSNHHEFGRFGRSYSKNVHHSAIQEQATNEIHSDITLLNELIEDLGGIYELHGISAEDSGETPSFSAVSIRFRLQVSGLGKKIMERRNNHPGLNRIRFQYWSNNPSFLDIRIIESVPEALAEL